MVVIFLFIALALSLLSIQAEALTTLNVTPSGAGYNSIQDAINAAPIATDTVLIRVAQGQYNEYVNFAGATSITIEGGWNSTFTSRDSNNRSTVVRSFQVSSSTATIDGFSCFGSDYNAIYLYGSNVILRNIRANNSSYKGDGPGIYALNNRSLAIYDSEIANNSTMVGVGGGIAVYDGTLLIKNSVIRDNQVIDRGEDGGGLYIYDTTTTIDSSWIYGNGTQWTGPPRSKKGGGIYSDRSYLRIVNSIVYNNFTDGSPGGALYYYASNWGKRGLSIINSTIANNFAQDSNGGVDIAEYATTTDTIQIRNSILWGNWEDTTTAPYFQESDLNIYKSGGATTPTLDISYNDIGRSTGLPFTGVGNLSTDPLYVDPVNGDYHLATGSPVIDAANAFGAPSVDIDGNSRPVGSGYDMGADEYVYSPPPITPLVDWDFEGSQVLTGDFTGDGKQDVATFYGYDGDQSRLWVFASNGNSLNGPEQWWDSGPGMWNGSATKAVVGDFNNDGWLDVAAFYGYGGNQSRIWLFANNHHGGFNSPTVMWDSGPNNWNGPATQIIAGDFNGDGNRDIAALYGYSGDRSRIWLFNGNGAGLNTPTIGWDSGPGNWVGSATKIAAADFNGDTKTDIAALYGYASDQSRIFTFPGKATGIDPPSILWDSGVGNWCAGATKIAGGDFNSDGKDDVLAFYAYAGMQSRLFIFETKSTGDALKDAYIWWDSGPGKWDGSLTRMTSGDFDGDGTVSSAVAVYRQTHPRTDLWLIGPRGTSDNWQRQM